MDKACETLLKAAARAPSGDNTQPWRFVVDLEQRRIELHLDESRDPSPMNTGQRMSRLAIGAALENMIVAARNLGWDLELEEPREPALASVRLGDCPSDHAELEPTIGVRGTNRRLYDGRPIAPALAKDLENATPSDNGIYTQWILQRERINALADLIGQADRVMLSEPSMRQAFLDNIRFDLSSDEPGDEGLPFGSLELSASDGIALRMMPYMPHWLLKIGGAGRKFAVAGRRLVASSSGLCLVVEQDSTPYSEVLAGRAMQRAWLALAARGFAVQPMMSLAILESLLSRGKPQLLASLGRERAASLVEEFRGLVPEISHGSIAFIMRFGFAPPPTVCAGRRDLSEVTQESACSSG